MSKFSEMVKSLEKREGYSKEVATKTAAKIGRERYGAKGMAEKAAAARGRDAAQENPRFGPSFGSVATRQASGERISGRELGAARDAGRRKR